MELLTQTLKNLIPEIGSSEDTRIPEKKIYAKFFCPWNNWKWFVTEYDPKTNDCFGFVMGFENEWGYFNVDELKQVRGMFGMKIERDLHFEPRTFGSVSVEDMAKGL